MSHNETFPLGEFRPGTLRKPKNSATTGLSRRDCLDVLPVISVPVCLVKFDCRLHPVFDDAGEGFDVELLG